MASKPWTGAEIDRAKRMYAEGHSAFEIGQTLGRYKDGVIRTLKAHGVKVRLGGPSLSASVCPTYRRQCEDAIIGSAELLFAIEKAGLRP